LQVRIPKGAKTGTKVRIAGEGAGQGGDLYLRVTVSPHDIFERTGDDLTEEVLIHLYTAVLGGEVQITTMAGKVMLKIPQGTQPGQVIRVRGKGMPKLRAPETFGDLYVRIDVEIPSELTAKERALFRELASFRD
jgi:curved DNA-binding protein